MDAPQLRILHNIIVSPKQMYSMDNVVLLPRPRRGLRGIVFTRSVCLSVCVSVCLCICVSGQYFGILFLGY